VQDIGTNIKPAVQESWSPGHCGD